MSDINEVIENSKKVEGIKMETQNIEGIELAKKEAVIPEKEVFPSFFIDSENLTRISLDVLFDRKDGKILSITKVGIGLNLAEYSNFGHVVTWFDFTLPNYDNISLYRQRCSVYNTAAKTTLIDMVQFRKFLIIWHLKDWSLKDGAGNKINLTCDETGGLSDESLTKVYNTFPSLLDVALTCFEKYFLL